MQVKGKLYGLKLIEQFGLPRPNWLFLTDPVQLPSVPWTNAPWGWTIRCALNTKYESFASERNLPFFNMLQWEDIITYIIDINNKYRGTLTYIVYPSWSFHSSGTILVTKSEIIVESVFGSLAKLTDGKVDPDLRLVNFRYPPFQTIIHDDNTSSIFNSSNNRLYQYYDIVTIYESILEWSITVENKLYFHQWDIYK